jgi:hypothetical protein
MGSGEHPPRASIDVDGVTKIEAGGLFKGGGRLMQAHKTGAGRALSLSVRRVF